MLAATALAAAAMLTVSCATQGAAARAASAQGGAGNRLKKPAPPQQITVNMKKNTGAVFHGATGALYGFSENGVPGEELISPLHVRAIDQKAPGGLQHPSGGALKVAPDFFAAGGQMILIYMQGIYSAWPYQNDGIANYLQKVKKIVKEVVAAPDSNRFAFVPFNEPDWIWYKLNTPDPQQYRKNRARFLKDWTLVYHAIRSLDPGAKIVGPNEAYYDARFMPSFLSYAKAHHVLPNIISWHELSPMSVGSYRNSYASFRTLEKRDGIKPLPVDIDEYGNRYDLSNPGEMVQWIAMFEDTKVYAAMPFWDIADNYSDNAVRNDEPNGSWWLLKWYGAMTGHTVRVTPPQYNAIDTLQGLASLNTAEKQARIIVSDPAGRNDSVVVKGIDPAIFGSKVHVSVRKTTWTGYDGSAYTPLDLSEKNYAVTDGSITVPLGHTDPMAAYELIIAPATKAPIAAPTPPETHQYLAAHADLTDATVYDQGSVFKPNGYATAGGKSVGSIDTKDSRVVFHVDVAHTGRYLMSVYYGNQTEKIAQQIMRVDKGKWSFVNYPPTLNRTFWSHKNLYLELPAGKHTITFGVSAPSIGTARGQATLDQILLTYAPGAVPGITGPATVYPAAYAELAKGDATVPCGPQAGACAAPQDVSMQPGSNITFVVDAARPGYYDLRLRSADHAAASATDKGSFLLAVGGIHQARTRVRMSKRAPRATHDITYLHAGINLAEYVYNGPGSVTVGALQVERDRGADRAVARYQAASPKNILHGTAKVERNVHGGGKRYVGGIGDGAGNTLTFTGIHAERSGLYRVLLSYSDGARVGSTSYNSNLIDRGFTVATSAGTHATVYARNTYSWDEFYNIELTVKLKVGNNTITFGNPSAPAPRIGSITVAPAYLAGQPSRRGS